MSAWRATWFWHFIRDRDEGDFFRGEKSRPFGRDESIGGDAECRVVMEATPTSAFEVVNADLIFEFLIVPFDAPAHMDGGDEIFERGGGGEVAEMVLGWCGFGFGPLDDQPLLRPQIRVFLTMGCPYTNRCEAGCQRLGGALPPGDGSPCGRGQSLR